MELNFNETDGVINVFKESNYTSHDIVAILRGILKIKKIGHAGTLDPNATGVLPVCIGKGTKISSYLMDSKKTYIAEITFGIETDTEDIWGRLINTDNSLVDMKLFKDNLKKYNNIEIKQIPPMYSAIKVNGKKLYELARKGINIERKERIVKIYDINLLKEYKNRVIIKIDCSKGTYIRTLIKDLCKESNSIGTMSNLLRINSGGMNIKNSLTISQIEYLVEQECLDFITPVDEALTHLRKIDLDASLIDKLVNGVNVKIDDNSSNELLRVYCSGIFIGFGNIISINDNSYLKIKNNFFRG